MRSIAVAIIAVALIAADLAGDLRFNGTDDNRAWALVNTVWLIFAAVIIWKDKR